MHKGLSSPRQPSGGLGGEDGSEDKWVDSGHILGVEWTGSIDGLYIVVHKGKRGIKGDSWILI